MNEGEQMISKVIRTPDYPIVETKLGKLHGFQKNSVFQFLGIQYGKAKRFQLPEMAEPWEGVKDAKAYGYVCPPLPEESHEEGTECGAPENTFEMQHRFWPQSENCLYLNIWTKSLNKHTKKPVMFWIHGGGYATGSSIEMYAYDGQNLCDHGDVVVVSVNHRLNCLGYLDLSSIDKKYQYSGCAGMADLVLALRWVQENIGAFGGDPGNVTVFGQSGGGSKVLTLMQMPPADGLYHKAIVESGAFAGTPGMTLEKNKRKWQELGEKVVKCLGLTADTIHTIEEISYEKLAEASVRAGQELGRPGGMMLFEPSPVPGYYEGSYDLAGMREEGKDIPVIVGTTLGEFSFGITMGDKMCFSEEEKKKRIHERYGKDTDRIIEEFLKAYPEKDILYSMGVDTMFRQGAQQYIKARNAFTKAPVYQYLFSVIIPYMGGTLPWHCAEIPFVFRNVEMEPAQCCGYEYAEQLTKEVSTAWINFAKKGVPAAEGLPWEAYTEEQPMVMYFDHPSRCVLVKDRELIRVILQVC